VSVHFDHYGGQSIINKRCCTNINILRLSVTYLNVTIHVKPELQNRRMEPTGLAKPGKTHWLTGTRPGFARQKSAGWVAWWFLTRTGALGLVSTRTEAGQPGTVANTRHLREHLGAPMTSLRVPMTSLGVPMTCLAVRMTNLEAPATCLGAP